MFNRMTDFAVRSRLIIILIVIALVIVSFFVLPDLKLDAFPDVTNVQVQVNTEAPGLAAKEVEQLITYPVESVMYSLPDVEQVRSISKTGLSVITVVFKEGTDIYFARQQVFQQLQRAKEQIPDHVGTPEIGPNTSGLGQVFQYVLRTDNPNKYTMTKLRSINDWIVKLQLLPVRGVTDVLSFGGSVKQYQVNIDPSKLLAHKLKVSDVVRAIEENNRNAGGWYLTQGNEQLVIRGEGWLDPGEKGLNEISRIPLKEVSGSVVRVRDVADVKFGNEIRQGATTFTTRNNKEKAVSLGESVVGIVLKRKGADTKETIDGIKERLPIIQQMLPAGVSIVPIYDQSSLINKAVYTVVKALIEAFIIILVVLMLFLLNIRATLLVIISIPISILLALMVMSGFNLSANLMSLGGLAIAIGMMVDGSVVMMENIFKHIGTSKDSKAKNKNSLQEKTGSKSTKLTAREDIQLRIRKAAGEVASPVFFAVLIIIVVFAPLLSLEGVEGKLFQPMAESVALAMIASLFVAIFVVPAISTVIFRREVRERRNYILLPLYTGYSWLLKKVLKHPYWVVAVTAALLAVAITFIPFMGSEFVPQLEEGTLNIRVTLSPSVNLETAIDVAQKLEAKLLTFPEVIHVSSRVGRPEIGGDPEPVSNVEMFVALKPVSDWASAGDRHELEEQMQKKLSVFPGLIFSFSQPIATRVDELLSGVKAQLAIKLFGPDLEILNKKGKEIEKIVKHVNGTHNVSMEQVSGEPQLVIKPKREVMMRYGVSVDQIMSLVSDEIGGKVAGQVINGNERYDIYVRLAKQYRDSVEAIKKLMIQAPNGAWVPLEVVASVKVETGAPQIRRDDVQRRVVIQSDVSGRDMGGVVSDIKKQINTTANLPSGYIVAYGGQFKNQERAQARLMVIIPLSLALIYLLLYFAFSSVTKALLVMVGIPLSLIGGIIALFITGQYLSVPSSVGFIALFGIAVQNGVVLVKAINDRIASGVDGHRAVTEATMSRFRPVLLTALTTALGLIPMLAAQGVGSEIQRPLATVVVGGLFSSTPLTLLLMPVLYKWFFVDHNMKFFYNLLLKFWDWLKHLFRFNKKR